jgi:hypothetical protein
VSFTFGGNFTPARITSTETVNHRPGPGRDKNRHGAFCSACTERAPYLENSRHERRYGTFISSSGPYSCCHMPDNRETADMVPSLDSSAVGIFINVLGPRVWMAIACDAITLHAPDHDSLAPAIRVADEGASTTKFQSKITGSQPTGIRVVAPDTVQTAIAWRVGLRYFWLRRCNEDNFQLPCIAAHL